MNERELRNRVKNKMIRPTTIPQSLEALIFEQAVAREALRLAYLQHKEFATTLKGVQQQRTVGDTFSQESGGETIVDNMKLDLAHKNLDQIAALQTKTRKRPASYGRGRSSRDQRGPRRTGGGSSSARRTRASAAPASVRRSRMLATGERIGLRFLLSGI